MGLSVNTSILKDISLQYIDSVIQNKDNGCGCNGCGIVRTNNTEGIR